MSPTKTASKKSQKTTAKMGPVVLEASRVLNEEGLSKVRPLVAGSSSKYGATRIYPGCCCGALGWHRLP